MKFKWSFSVFINGYFVKFIWNHRIFEKYSDAYFWQLEILLSAMSPPQEITVFLFSQFPHTKMRENTLWLPEKDSRLRCILWVNLGRNCHQANPFMIPVNVTSSDGEYSEFWVQMPKRKKVQLQSISMEISANIGGIIIINRQMLLQFDILIIIRIWVKLFYSL